MDRKRKQTVAVTETAERETEEHQRIPENKVPNNVRKIREALLLSKAELARKAGVSALTIDRIESGYRCRMDTKRKIILALGMRLSDKDRVFGPEEPPEPRRRRSGEMPKGKNVLGLDIGSSAVKLVQLKETKRGYQLQNLGIAPLPAEAIVDGALMNSTVIVSTIRDLIHSHRIRQKETGLAISGHSVIIKKIPLPAMTPEELEESIQWEAEQYIPFDIHDVNIDVQVLTANPSEHGQMDVLLVAAKKDMINDYLAVVQEAGLTPLVVDVATFCVQNAFEINYDISPSDTIVLVNIGASVINIDIVSGGTWAFSRDISMGGNVFTEEIQKQLNVSREEAEALKLGGHSPTDAESVVPQEVERVIASVADTMAGEIQRSLDFYATTAADSQLSRIYLCGGACRLPSLYKVIENKVGVPVEIMNPFRNVEFDPKRFDPEFIRQVGPATAVALGLATRSPDDK